jgi:hypothetical protein
VRSRLSSPKELTLNAALKKKYDSTVRGVGITSERNGKIGTFGKVTETVNDSSLIVNHGIHSRSERLTS